MKSVRYEGRDARRFLAALVMDPVVCARVSAIWNGDDLFSSKPENIIAGWCVKYMKKYGTSPGASIRGIYEDWAVGMDSKVVEQVEALLSALNDDWIRDKEHYRTDYVLDVGSELFTRVRVRKAIEESQADLEDRNDVGGAYNRISRVNRVDLKSNKYIRVGLDIDPWMQYVEDNERVRPYVRYQGDLGKFVGNEFCQDSFVVLMASSKRGKSFWLKDLAYRVVRSKYNLAYFDAGDMSRRQVMTRLGRRVLRRPREEGYVDYPIEYNDPTMPPVRERRWLKGVSGVESYREWNRLCRNQDLFRLMNYSARSLTTADLRGNIEDWAREGWMADVVIIDYADILAPPSGVEQTRDQINSNWIDLRKLSQDFHCCVVTATQADAGSYDGKQLKRKNFSDDRRKHDHVTAMLALTVSDDDKDNGITRVSFLDRREGAYSERKEVLVAGCLDIACPVIHSVM